MPLSLYDATIPSYLQILTAVLGLIDKAEAFCAEKGIAAEIEMIDIGQINDAYERMIKSDVRYRFVIDMKSLPRQKAA